MDLTQAEIDPAEAGFDAARLVRLDEHFARYVADGRLAGWQLAITRGGKLAHSSGRGHQDRENDIPVAPDTIWRIFSMTKPIASIAAMMLWEEGAFELHDPVAKFIPEFGDVKVWRGGSVTKPDLEPLMRPIEMWHLFTHTAGLTYGFMYNHPVDELYRRAGFEWGVPQDTDLAGICSRIAAQPLLFQPGTEWSYSMAIDVLGRVIEVISGQTLGEFLQERLFAPLGMVDTAFWAPEDKADRVAVLYGAHPVTGEATSLGAFGDGALREPKAGLGGGGLVSTMSDYLHFAELLRAKGTYDGQQLLSPRTIAYMTRNHLPGNADLTAFGRPLFSETTFDGVGFGLLGSVTIDPVAAKVPGSVGEYGWGGAASTFFWVDPVEDITCVFMTQLLPSNTHPIRSQLKQMVSQAIVA